MTSASSSRGIVALIFATAVLLDYTAVKGVTLDSVKLLYSLYLSSFTFSAFQIQQSEIRIYFLVIGQFINVDDT